MNFEQSNIFNVTESNFKKILGTENAILVNNGTAALHTAYLALEIGKGDEVIVPSYTYYSTVNMIIACGATPIFCDINPVTYLMDTTKLIKLMTNKTKAIVFVCLFGKEPSEADIKNLDLGVPVIMDCAQCFKQNMGQYYDIQCFSFYRSKNLSSLEGGLITTNDKELANKCRIISNQGEDGKYNTTMLGFNYRMNELTATMLNHNLTYHEKGWNSELGRFSPKDGHYPNVVYEQPLYKRLGYYDIWKGKCPNAEMIAKEVREKYWCKK